MTPLEPSAPSPNPVDAQATRGTVKPRASGDRVDAGDPQRPTVLVIEDDAATAELFCFLLDTIGFAARSVGDGNHAMGIARACRPTVILSDIDLPGRDGFALAMDFQADPLFSHTPLVAVSGRLDDDRATQACRAGFARFLPKPVSPETLSRTLSEVPDRRRRQAHLPAADRRKASSAPLAPGLTGLRVAATRRSNAQRLRR